MVTMIVSKLNQNYTCSAFDHCTRPCSEVSYTLDVDTFFLKPDELLIHSEGQCDNDSGIITVQFSRSFISEVVSFAIKILQNFKVYNIQEDYIIKSVDLFSGFGGAIGLWLGWSAMTLGDILLEALKTLFKIRIMK